MVCNLYLNNNTVIDLTKYEGLEVFSNSKYYKIRIVRSQKDTDVLNLISYINSNFGVSALEIIDDQINFLWYNDIKMQYGVYYEVNTQPKVYLDFKAELDNN